MAAGLSRLACGVLVLALAAGVAQAQTRFRYALPRRECWTYERQVDVTRDGRIVHTARQTVRIWFLTTRADEADVWVEIAPVGDDQEIVYAAPMTIDRLGRRRSPAQVADRLPEIHAALEMLPGLAPAIGSAARWESDVDANGRFLRQTLAEGAARVQYDVIDREGVDTFLGRRASGTYTWDGAAGRVSRVEERALFSTQSTEMITRIRFVEAGTFSELWRVRRIKEVGRFVTGIRNEAAWLTRAGSESIDADMLPARLDRLWVEFLRGEPMDDDSPVCRAAHSRRRELRAIAETLRERARLSGQWLGTHAAAWSLLTPTGETLKSETLGTQGLIEVFWSARSPAALRAFAEIRSAAAAASRREVAIVCINLDTDVNLAKQAIDACGRGLVHVLSGPPIGGESPTDLPIIRFLDGQRRVARVQFGRPSRLENVIEQVYGR